MDSSRASETKRNVDEAAAPPKAPEVHLIGDVMFGTDFGDGVSCKWRFDHGKYWGILEGSAFGHTQTAYGQDGCVAVWNHPFDIHYQTTSMEGWPRLIVQV